MLVPLFNLVTHRPDLVIDHLAGYIKLAQDEVSDAKQQLIRRAIAGSVAIVFAMAFIVLAGVALMLANTIMLQPIGVQTFATTSPSMVVLIAVPAVALIAAIIAALVALKSGADETSVSFADHVQRDIQAFRQVVQAKQDRA